MYNALWEMDNKVSTREQTVALLVRQMPQPVGILIFGTHCTFKTRIKTELLSHIHPTFCDDYDQIDNDQLSQRLSLERKRTALELQPDQQSEAIQRLRAAGAQSIAGIYIRPLELNLQHDGTALKELQSLREHPPTVAELDHFVTITERK